MKPWQIALSALIVLFGYAVMMAPRSSSLSASPSPSMFSKEDSYARKTFMDVCDTEPGFTAYCGCAYDYIIAHMSIAEIESMADASDQEVSRVVQPAYEACSHKLY